MSQINNKQHLNPKNLFLFFQIQICNNILVVISDQKFSVSVSVSAEISVSVCLSVSVSVLINLSVSAKISVENWTENRNICWLLLLTDQSVIEWKEFFFVQRNLFFQTGSNFLYQVFFNCEWCGLKVWFERLSVWASNSNLSARKKLPAQQNNNIDQFWFRFRFRYALSFGFGISIGSGWTEIYAFLFRSKFSFRSITSCDQYN